MRAFCNKMANEIVPSDEPPKPGTRINHWLLVALVGAVLAGLLIASSVWDTRFKGDENATGNEVATAGQASDLEQLCASQTTYDALRKELFRRAAQVRGSDDQAYTRLEDFALLRMNSPVVRGIDDQLRNVTCSGSAILELPPGVEVAGGRRSLSGDVDYMIQPAADGTGNVIRLGNADSIVVPLATLSRSHAPENAPLIPPTNEIETNEVQPEQVQQAQSGPSFDCRNARSRTEVTICNDPGLASLDREMATNFNRAMIGADQRQRQLLQGSRARFLSYRDRCATNQCIADVYRSRMQEIDDIMADRWRG